MKRFILFGLLVLVIVAVGFGSGWLAATSRPASPQSPAESPTPSVAEASLKAHTLWGMTLGSKRVYVAENETETLTVEAIRIEKDRVIYSIKSVDDRGDTRVEDVYQDAEGIWYQEGELETPARKELRLMLPCQQGDTWRIVTGDKYVCEGTERVTVPAGTFDTIKITLSVSAPTGMWYDAYWYSMEHGLIQHQVRQPLLHSGSPFRENWTIWLPQRDSLFKLASVE